MLYQLVIQLNKIFYQDGLKNTGENIENNIVSSFMKDSWSPIEDGQKSIFTEMSNSLLFLLQSQQQKSSIMDYLSWIAGAGIVLCRSVTK